MIDLYVTQRGGLLSQFSTDIELFRSAPEYDFVQLPNEGLLFYERVGWGLTGSQWCTLASRSLKEL